MLMDFKGPTSMIEAFKPKVLECLLDLDVVRLLVGLIERLLFLYQLETDRFVYNNTWSYTCIHLSVFVRRGLAFLTSIL